MNQFENSLDNLLIPPFRGDGQKYPDMKFPQ